MEWVPWLVDNAARVVVGLIIAAGNFIAAAAAGAVIAVVVAWLERRWRRQEVRAAEKRARLEERFEPVLRYAAGLQGFVLQAAQFMSIWEQVRGTEGSEPEAKTMLRRLEEEWRRAKALEPRPGPYVVVRDVQAQTALVGLEMVANGCRHRCRVCLKAGGVVSGDELSRWVADTEKDMQLLRQRTEGLVEDVQG